MREIVVIVEVVGIVAWACARICSYAASWELDVQEQFQGSHVASPSAAKQ